MLARDSPKSRRVRRRQGGSRSERAKYARDSPQVGASKEKSVQKVDGSALAVGGKLRVWLAYRDGSIRGCRKRRAQKCADARTHQRRDLRGLRDHALAGERERVHKSALERPIDAHVRGRSGPQGIGRERERVTKARRGVAFGR